MYSSRSDAAFARRAQAHPDDPARRHAYRDDRSRRLLLRAVADALAGRPERSGPWIDVGCGDGSFSRSLLGAPRGTGLDRVGAMARAARAGGLRAAQADAARLPFRSESARLLLACGVLQYTQDPGGAFAEFARAIAPGGVVVVCAPNRTHFLRLRGDKEGDPPIRSFGLAELKALGASAGLTAVRVLPVAYPWGPRFAARLPSVFVTTWVILFVRA